MIDVLIIGAGPAGMSAALELQGRGLEVTIVDDQPAPGGRIFAAIEHRPAHDREEREGASLTAQFRAAGGTYLSNAELWQIEPGPRAFVTQNGRARMFEPSFILLATGAQERPMPFTGWQLPGVMTIGAAQILLKTASQIPDEPVWLAGTGPLLLLYATQLIATGGTVAGILDTTPPHRLRSAIRSLPAALPYGWRELLRGLRWKVGLRGIQVIRNVAALEAVGRERLCAVRYKLRDGTSGEIATRLLLVHDGVVPSIHGTLSADCAHHWNPAQRCLEPTTDIFCTSSIPSIFLAGDGATIAGARAAFVAGRLAAIGIARAAGKMDASTAEAAAKPLRRHLRAAAAFRRFIDTLYPPVELPIPDETLLCRCEEVTAGRVRASLVGRPHLGADGAKIETRAGMGPCQGRQCGASLARLIAEVNGSAREHIQFLRIRPPLKPLTLEELASLEAAS